MTSWDRGGGGSGEPGLSWWDRWDVFRMLRADRAFRFVLIGLGVVVLGGVLGTVRWIPGHRWPDGRVWRLHGYAKLRCVWHDLRKGRPGEPGFVPDAPVWLRRANLDPGDPVPIRGYLDSLLARPGLTGVEVTNALKWGGWLLRAGGTNSADVRRYLRVVEASAGADEFLTAMDGFVPGLDLGTLGVWAERAADAERWDVVERWVRMRGEAVGLAERAWSAGWGAAAGSLGALAELEAVGRGGGPLAVRARRLLVQVGVKRTDLAGAAGALAGLEAAGAARLRDRIRVGRLRVALGRVEELRADAERWPEAQDPMEAAMAIGLWLELGDRGRAVAGLKRALARWPRAGWWMQLAEVQWGASDWVGLKSTALWLREAGVEGGRRVSVGWRLEAVALEGLGRVSEAAAAWRSGQVTEPIPVEEVWEWARRFAVRGRLREVGDWVRAAEGVVGGAGEYWRLRSRLARETGDAEEWGRVVSRWRAVEPGRVEAVLEQAWALLVLRRAPEEVLRLLDQDAVRAGGGGRVDVLELGALVQRERWAEAENRLRLLEGRRLGEPERTMLFLWRFEMHLRREQNEEALKAYREIDARQLLPIQLRWLEEEYGRIARGGTTGGEAGRKP